MKRRNVLRIFVLLLAILTQNLFALEKEYKHREQDVRIQFDSGRLRFVMIGIPNGWFPYTLSESRIIVPRAGAGGGDVIIRMEGHNLICDEFPVAGTYLPYSAKSSIECVSGDCTNGVGVLVRNGERIEGHFKNGQPDGQVTMTSMSHGVTIIMKAVAAGRKVKLVGLRMTYSNGAVLEAAFPSLDEAPDQFEANVITADGATHRGIYDSETKILYHSGGNHSRVNLCKRERPHEDVTNMVCNEVTASEERINP
ncbi:MAG: hypothetical protein K1X70_09620 [Leptospirales bacterium]|nr:hypothetical protein [Leptospirales bacterium]